MTTDAFADIIFGGCSHTFFQMNFSFLSYIVGYVVAFPSDLGFRFCIFGSHP